MMAGRQAGGAARYGARGSVHPETTLVKTILATRLPLHFYPFSSFFPQQRVPALPSGASDDGYDGLSPAAQRLDGLRDRLGSA